MIESEPKPIWEAPDNDASYYVGCSERPENEFSWYWLHRKYGMWYSFNEPRHPRWYFPAHKEFMLYVEKLRIRL